MKGTPFSAPMILVLQKKLKTVTRRVIEPQPVTMSYATNPPTPYDAFARPIACPFAVGETRYVKEALVRKYDPIDEQFIAVYLADGNRALDFTTGRSIVWKWQRDKLPSIYMPHAATRLWIKVTAVKPLPLHAMTQADAVKEGVRNLTEYRGLWDSLHLKHGCGWESNPTVWVVEFTQP